MAKLKRDDEVIVIAGKDKGKRGTVRRIIDSDRVVVSLRNISKLILDIREGRETLAMIGIRKPSLHFYSRQIVFYEPNTKEGY